MNNKSIQILVAIIVLLVIVAFASTKLQFKKDEVPKGEADSGMTAEEQADLSEQIRRLETDLMVADVLYLKAKMVAMSKAAKRCKSLLPKVIVRNESGADPFAASGDLPAARVAERKMLGAHDIRIVELLDPDRFSAWVTAEFGVDNERLEIPAPLLAVIDEYVKDGYKWFIFDVVDVKKELAKKTPLRIQFETDKLYYPMRITRTEKGHTTVTLSILTNVLFNREDCIGIPRESIKVPARPIAITGARVNWIDPPLYELLGRPQTVQLRTWEIAGEIDTFQKDLLIRNPATANEEGEQDAAPNR